MNKIVISAIKIGIAYLLSLFNVKYRDYWLIEERGFDARDNGYWFYKYLVENHPEVKVMYSITPDSEDLEKIKMLGGEYVYRNSIRHGIIYFVCEALLSPHDQFCRPLWKGLGWLQKITIFKFLRPRGKKIFLQHGITKDYIEFYTKSFTNADMFICGALPEYEFIKKRYGYAESEVKYTGFARFDNLEKNKFNNKKMILIIPTWRSYIDKNLSEHEFKQTDYYKKYNSLLNNANLIEYIEENDIKVVFYPHILMQQWINCFTSSSEKICIMSAHNIEVQDLLIKCSMLVTDYSSVFFDVAYMNKPTIFYQFDYSTYRSGYLQEGYYDYHNDLGPVCDTEEELVNQIINSYGKLPEEKYLHKIKEYFVYQDQNNCNRIYKEVIGVRD